MVSFWIDSGAVVVMNFIVSNVIGAKRFNGFSKMFSEATVYTGEQVIVEARIQTTETEAVRKYLSHALLYPLEYNWQLSKIPHESIYAREIHFDSCEHFSWPIRAKLSRRSGPKEIDL